MPNIFDRLANMAKQKAQQLGHDVAQAPQAVGNVVSHIGAAPHPVQINTPQVQQAFQHAKFGVLANPMNAQNAIRSLNAEQQAAQPTVSHGLNNAMDAINNTNAHAGRFIAQNLVTRPGMEVAQSVRQAVTHQPSQFTPGSPQMKAVFGDTPIQSLQANHASTQAHLQQSYNPLVRATAPVLAGANTALHVLNDVPVVGAAVKAGVKGTAAAAPKLAELAPKAAPVLNAIGKGAESAAQTLDKGAVATAKAVGKQVTDASAKRATAANYDATISDLNKQKAALQNRIQNTTNFRGVETTQQHVDQIDRQIAAAQANKPQLSLKDRVLAPNIGLGTGKVTPVAVPEDMPAAVSKGAAVPEQPPEVVGKDAVSLPNVSTQEHLQQQIAAQEAARKAGSATGLDKVKAGVADIKAKMVDSLSPIEDRLNTKITADNATSHITPQLDRALRTDTIAGQYIKENGLAHVIQNVPNTKEFDQYLIAKHAADLNKQGIKTGRNAAADAQLVKDLGSKYEPHAQALKQYSNSLLDKAAEYGLISKDLPAQLKEKYPNYVPANRIFGENELATPPKGLGGGKASIGQQSVVQKIKGSNRVIESPLSSIIDKTHAVIDQGERNKAAQVLTGYKDLPGNPFNLRELKPTETVGEKHVISVLDNGKTRRFETDPAIAAAAKSLNKEQLGLVGKILNAPVRVLRMGATSLNPAFTGANIVKDLVTGAINSSHPLRSSVANPEVFVQALKASLNHGSKEYSELVREGAGGTSFDIARGEAVNNVKSIRAQKNAGTKIAYTVTHPAQLFRAAENAIGRSEEFSRALQYYGNKSAATASGASEDAARVLAAHAARNNTTNFARSGDFGKVLNSVIPYLNAGFQGSRTLVRNLGDRPAQTTAKLVVGAFMPVAATTAWNVATPDRKAAYDDIKPYEKQGNLIIVPPNPVKDPATGKWNVIKIPLSQEVANLGNTVRNGIETGLHDGSFNAAQMVGDLLGTATSLNIQSPRQAFGQVMPQALKVPAEMITNQNLFTGNKIVPDSQKNLDPRDQYGPTSSGTARVIGNLTNTSPRQIDNAVRTGVGGLGQNLINASDNALSKLGVIKPTDIRGTSFAQAAQKRFNGAQGSSQYDNIDTKSKSLTDQIKSLPTYQSMSPADKAKALNRATNAVTSTYTTKKALTPKQQAIDNGTAKASSFLAASTGGSTIKVNTSIDPHSQKVLNEYNTLDAATKKSKAYNEPSYDYKVAQAKYDNAKANGTLSKAQLLQQQQAVDKAKVGSNFSKDVRELYNVNKSDLYSFLTSDPNGAKYADQLKSYDQALKDSGVASSLKFKNGFNTASKSGGGSGGGKRGFSGTGLQPSDFKTPFSNIVASTTKGASLARSAKLANRKGGSTAFNPRKVTLRKLA